MWFEQDGITPHFAKKNIQFLKEKFNYRIISINGDVNWPEDHII